MKKYKVILNLVVLLFSTAKTWAQTDSFLVSTASKFKSWSFLKTEFDKYKFGEAVLKKVEKQYGVATNIVIENNGSFTWTITKGDSTVTKTGVISETETENYFEFDNGDKLKVSASFKNYDTEMCITIYGREADEFVNLIYKKQSTPK